jgi:predicted Fe-Mo cluster-binding NifX family protein
MCIPVIVDSESMQFEAIQNVVQMQEAAQGFKTAQMIVDKGAKLL